jgi:hypothetical protein
MTLFISPVAFRFSGQKPSPAEVAATTRPAPVTPPAQRLSDPHWSEMTALIRTLETDLKRSKLVRLVQPTPSPFTEDVTVYMGTIRLPDNRFYEIRLYRYNNPQPDRDPYERASIARTYPVSRWTDATGDLPSTEGQNPLLERLSYRPFRRDNSRPPQVIFCSPDQSTPAAKKNPESEYFEWDLGTRLSGLFQNLDTKIRLTGVRSWFAPAYSQASIS